MRTKTSKWFWWSFLPFFNFAAWLHAAIRSGRASHLWSAGIYSVPFCMALVLGAIEEPLKLQKETVEAVNGVGAALAMVLWVGGIIHALVSRKTVDRQIEDYDVGRVSLAGAAPRVPPPVPSPASCRKREVVGTVGTSVNVQGVRSGVSPAVGVGASAADSPTRSFKYIDCHGNLVGPATLTALRSLKQAGVISESTRIIDEQAGRSCLAADLFRGEAWGGGAESGRA